jgi:hypothetical protein
VDLSVAVVNVGPTAGQPFPGQEQQVGFLELLRILQLLSGVVTPDQVVMQRVEQIIEAQHSWSLPKLVDLVFID